MSENESDVFKAREEARHLIATYYKVNFGRLFWLVRQRFPSLDPEDMLQGLLVKILNEVDSCRAPAEVAILMDKWTNARWAATSLLHLCVDHLRSGPGRQEDAMGVESGSGEMGGPEVLADRSSIDPHGNLLDPEPGGRYPEHPDQVPGYLDSLRKQRAVDAILQALLERGRNKVRGFTHITERQFEVILALYSSSRPTTDDSEELTDHELRVLSLEVAKLRRARWEHKHGYSDPEAGNQAAAAAALGITTQAVSQSRKEVRSAIFITRYIAGVLAAPGTLLSPAAIHFHLDQFDGLARMIDGREHRSVLAGAAPAVRTTPEDGTRVQPQLLKHRDPAGTDAPVDVVHTAETFQARITDTAYPNCVSICSCHTILRNRATEI